MDTTMTTKLVKTGVILTRSYVKSDEEPDKKYLILPDGLDKLEEMLKEEFSAEHNAGERVTLIFARFKKENGI
jgi:hypothetical protein